MNNLENRLNEIKISTADSLIKRKRSKYSYIDSEIVIGLLEESARMPEIAEMYGCSYAVLKYQMRINNPKFDARKYHKWRKREISTEKVVGLYEEIRSCTKIAKLLKVETHVITNRLKVAGVKLRPLYREDISTEEVVELYKKYKRTSKVADKLKTNLPLVRRRLIEAGIEIDVSYRNERKRTDIPIKTVLRLYDNWRSVNSIAEKYSCSFATIRKILVDNDRVIRPHLPCFREDITPEKAAYWYSKLKRISKVADKLETDNATIRRRLRAAGVETDLSFRNERKRTDIPIKNVKKLRERRESILSVARKYKTKRETIRRILDGYWD